MSKDLILADLQAENTQLNKELDAIYDILKVSRASSRPLACFAADLMRKLNALCWTEIDSEHLPHLGDELFEPTSKSIRAVRLAEEVSHAAEYHRLGYTHFRAINAPEKFNQLWRVK